jgi:hemolysin activation/secretion protein
VNQLIKRLSKETIEKNVQIATTFNVSCVAVLAIATCFIDGTNAAPKAPQRGAQTNQVLPLSQSSTSSSKSKPKQNTETTEVLIPVKKILVVGSSILSEAEISKIIAPYLQKSLTLEQIRAIADQFTQIYQERNYITSRAILQAQEINDGVVTIKILEGTLERVDIRRAGDVEGRLNDDYLRSRALLAGDKPINFTRLEEELQLLRSNPLLSDVRANLAAGSSPDQSVLQITFSEAKSLNINLFTDNYGNVSSGIYRAGASLQELNLTGIGDSGFISYIRSGGANSYALGYQYPLNPTGGTLSLNASISDSRVTQPEFASLNIATDSQVYEIAYRQPVIRSPREELVLGASFGFENSSSSVNGQPFNFQNQALDDGRSQARVLKLTQDYVNRDSVGAWAFRSVFSAGLNILGATIRTDGSPDGRFLYWTGQALRVQRLGSDRDTLAFFRVNAQFTGDRLLSLNRFSVGGPQSIRGYRQNQNTGDNGIQASLEVQFPIVRDDNGLTTIKLLPFIEAGSVWNNRTSNPIPQTLFSVGLGAVYQPLRNLAFRVDFGIPLVNANNSGSNLQDSGLYFSVNGNF